MHPSHKNGTEDDQTDIAGQSNAHKHHHQTLCLQILAQHEVSEQALRGEGRERRGKDEQLVLTRVRENIALQERKK